MKMAHILYIADERIIHADSAGSFPNLIEQKEEWVKHEVSDLFQKFIDNT